MALPLRPPVLPQLAKSQKTLPTGDGWVYEPKWDGFRSIAFVDGDSVHLQSRNGKPLTRYFPELKFPEGRYVLDGEIVLFDDKGRQDFDALGQRIHPAKSRIDMLAQETPTRFIAFDVLAIEDESLLELTQRERRGRLEQLVEKPVDLTPPPRIPPRRSHGCRAPRAWSPSARTRPTGRASASGW
jgi:ATP-dependent DNA ligase